MPLQGTNAHHHHQKKESNVVPITQAPLTAEAELAALAASRGQTLTAHVLRAINDELELKGATLQEFVEHVRQNFGDGIRNPSGFFISVARKFRSVSRPALIPARLPDAESPGRSKPSCDGGCSGGLVLQNGSIDPCPKCSTPESRREWELKEAERKRRAKAPDEGDATGFKAVSPEVMRRLTGSFE
jgi:hypothetical protein